MMEDNGIVLTEIKHIDTAPTSPTSDEPLRKFVENENTIYTSENESSYKRPVRNACGTFRSFLEQNKDRFILLFKVVLVLLYLAYFGYAQKFYKNDEPSWRLIGFTIFGAILLSWKLLMKTRFKLKWDAFVEKVGTSCGNGRIGSIIRWLLYVAMSIFMVVYVIVEVALRTPDNLRSLMGIFIIPAILFMYSNNKRKVNWHTVFWGMAIQFVMALIILKTSWGAGIIRWIGNRLEEYLSIGHVGSEFLFGKNYKDHNFVFGSMIQAFLLVLGISVLTYLGVVDFVVKTLGRFLAFCLQTTPVEGINTVGNVFLHLPESVMLIQNSLNDMTPSQLFVTYAGGMATVGGTSLVVFIGFGIPTSHLVAASSMSAPAALAVAKLVFPSHNQEVVPQPGRRDEVSIIRKAKSLMDSIIIGIGQGVKLIIQVSSYIAAFVMILAFINMNLVWFGNRIEVDNMTIECLFSYVFYPFAFIMGAAPKDCLKIGELLAVRAFSLALIAYRRQGPIIENGKIFRAHIAESTNHTWVQMGDDIFLPALNKTLVNGIMEPRSDVILTYALCGSASFAIAGIVIGSFKAILPHRLDEVSAHILRAAIAGTAASFLTACYAGLLFEEGI